ncbi:T9SS type A sorting domain-containing protein [Flavobacterium sp. MFBS3-15]|uniref:Ig-like domain-containing protein n=1 Tax=Flavobacterium sp. MFBS3-15 TaxID=2989816 RepID=UPI0022355B75|nr:T9SS type A sorting domain-containing protein [Flavobacterium sp. MFBS3-15]MCW4468362.1 T9SS type A sorting domain-containing protein [Flavobacterium sp. MFBS3-15]
MKKKLFSTLTVFAAVLSSYVTKAQTYEHLQVATGFSADVIANGAGTAMSSTTAAVDAANYNFMSNDFQPTAAPPPAYALPASGLITSLVNSAITYQLAPLSGNNALQVSAQNASGTITFTNTVIASRLYVIATTGSGASTITATIQFSDASTQVIPGVAVPDWFDSTAQPIAAWGFGRVLRTTNAIENPANNPRMYQLALNILPENQLKTVTGIQFTKTSSAEGILNVFAVTAELTGACPSPGSLTAVATADAATLNWTPSVLLPAAGYDYYYSTSSTPPTGSTVPSGNVASGVNTVGLSGLATGQLHYAWVRSNCSETEKGPWVMVTFTPGQISGGYNSGDIPTLYGTPSTTTANTCPGIITINVPAGYQIASVATAYTMTTASNGWTSEQRSLLACTTTNTTEAAVTAGANNSGGTQAYNRTGLTLANGATGAVTFELRAWRTFGGSGCNTTWNRVDNNSWTVTVTYSPLNCTPPASPTAAAQNVCSGSTVSALTATGLAGATFSWYAAATGGTALPGTTPLTATTYYVSQIVSGCESARTPVAVTINSVAAPTASAQSFCPGATVAGLTASGSAGAEFNWYAGASGGTELATTAVLSATTYYVSQTVSGCESARTPVAVTINTVAAPTASPQNFCTSGTVAGLSATGTAGATFHWYAAATGGTELSSDTALTATTYYVSQTVGGCESARAAVSVTITALPAPTAADQAFCVSGTVAGLVASGVASAELHWYDVPTGSTPLAGTTALAEGTYYVSQSLNGCESDRESIDVTIMVTPVPEVEPEATGCYGITVDDATGGLDIFHVYESETGGTELEGSYVFTSGTYYVSQTLDGCESARVPVEVTVIELNEPAIAQDQEFCSGATLADVVVEYSTSAEVTWHATAGGEALPSSTVIVDGASYFAVQHLGVCESEPSQYVAMVHATPDSPEGEAEQDFTEGETVASLEVTTDEGATVTWYVLDGTTYGAVSEETVLEDGQTYYCSQWADGCESAFLAVTANEVLSTGQFGLSNLMVYPNPAADVLNITNDLEIIRIAVTNLLGQKVMDRATDGNEVQVDISQLQQGNYILQVYTEKGTASLKIAKR